MNSPGGFKSTPLPEVAILPSLTEAFRKRAPKGTFKSPAVCSFAPGSSSETHTIIIGGLHTSGEPTCRISSATGDEASFTVGSAPDGEGSSLWARGVQAVIAKYWSAVTLPEGAGAFTAVVHGPASEAALLLLLEDMYEVTLPAEEKARILGGGEAAGGGGGGGGEGRRVDLAQYFPEQHGCEVLKQARLLKAAGNELFKKGDVRGALQKYHRIHFYIGGLKKKSADDGGGGMTAMMPANKQEEALTHEQRKEVAQLMGTMHMNKAMCYVKQEMWEKGIDACSKALDSGGGVDEGKALFRRGVCHSGAFNLDKAQADLDAAAKLSPADIAIQKALKQLLVRHKEADKKSQAAFKLMFSGDRKS